MFLLIFITAQVRAQAQTNVIMAVFAHPDDEIGVSPILHKLSTEGHQVYLVYATDGRKGITPFSGLKTEEEVAQVRKEEAKCVCNELSIQPPIMLDFADGSLYEMQVQQKLKQSLTEQLQKLKPNIVLTWGPDGGYGHSDPRMVSNILSDTYLTDTLNQYKNLYFTGFPSQRINRSDFQTFGAKWLMANFSFINPKYLNHEIPYSQKDFNVAAKAYHCYKSQYTPETMNEILSIIQEAGDLKAYFWTPFLSDNLLQTITKQ